MKFGIAAAQDVEKHCDGFLQRCFSRSDTATAARMMRPRTIIWSETERPIRISPLLSMPIISEPTSAPTIEPLPPLRQRAADDDGGDHGHQVGFAERIFGGLQPAGIEQPGKAGEAAAEDQHQQPDARHA